jgi:perosamine synthetase
MGVTSEDEVIVPVLTFIAAVNPVKYIGAEPVFMDCNDSLCIDPIKFNQFCEEECYFDGEKLIDKGTKRQVKAVVVVHVFGNMVDMEMVCRIASKYHLKVVEDATEALGTFYTVGLYKGRYAGTIGDIGVYSFNGNKIITTGGGGMIVSNHADYLSKAKHLTTQAKADELYYVHDEIGYNYRMTNLQAALGLAQLEQLEKFIEVKKQNYELYCDLINSVEGLDILPFREGTRANHWFYSLLCIGDRYERDKVIKHLAGKHIQSRPIWGIICDQKPYLDAKTYKIEKAKYYWERVVNIPCSTSLTTAEVRMVVRTLLGVVQ